MQLKEPSCSVLYVLYHAALQWAVCAPELQLLPLNLDHPWHWPATSPACSHNPAWQHHLLSGQTHKANHCPALYIIGFQTLNPKHAKNAKTLIPTTYQTTLTNLKGLNTFRVLQNPNGENRWELKAGANNLRQIEVSAKPDIMHGVSWPTALLHLQRLTVCKVTDRYMLPDAWPLWGSV